jgi:hypothetical protein
MFNAISYIGNQGIIHSKINTHSFRICSQTGNVILSKLGVENEYTTLTLIANFECIEEFPEGKLPNTDLENLGLTIIHCVEGDTLKSLDDVRERRMSNAFFIANIEPWVGSEQFTDFLDYLFSRSRAASNKLKSPVSLRIVYAEQ